MSTLEELQPNAVLRGILLDCAVTVVYVKWSGSEALELTYKDPLGKVGKTFSTVTMNLASNSSKRDGHGASTETVSFFGSFPRRTASAWLTSSIRFSRFTHLWWNLCPTRSPRSTRPCRLASHFGSYSPTTRVPGRRSWRDSSSRS